MAISREEVRRVAALAHLRLTEDEEARMAGELSRILEWVARLDAVDTEGVAPLAHVHDVTCPVRDDEARPSLPVERAIENAPESEDGAYVVPRIIGEAP